MNDKPAPKPCLLIIDDDSDVRATLQAALCEDYTVFCLPNGDNVLAQIDLARHDRLPIFFMTAKLDGSRFAQVGEDACIGMPFEMRQLRRCIDFLLAKGEKK